MVPTPAEAAVVSGEGGEQREGSCSASSSACSNISNRLSSSSGWDVEADATLLELLGEDSRILSEVSGLPVPSSLRIARVASCRRSICVSTCPSSLCVIVQVGTTVSLSQTWGANVVSRLRLVGSAVDVKYIRLFV